MKIKNILTSLIFSFTTIAFAQVDSLCIKRTIPYRWELSVAMNSVEAQMDQKLFDTWVYPSANYYAYYGDKSDKSFSVSIIPKYKIKDNISVRCELGMTNIDLRSYYEGIGDTATQSQGHIGGTADIIKKDIIEQKIYRYLLGIQWQFIEKKFIGGYCGASLNYFHYGNLYWNDYILNTTSAGRSTNYTAITPGGYAFGTGMLVGINIYFSRQISLGGEFLYSLLYYQLGGIQNGTKEELFPTSPKQTVDWKIHNNKSEGIQFTKIMPSLNLTIRF